MRNRPLQWTLAIVVTLASAYYQRVTGPTYPLKGAADLAGQAIEYRLERTHVTGVDQPVRVTAADAQVTGEVRWRRFPSDHPWETVPMVRSGEVLEARLPFQPPAGKVEYQVRLVKGAAHVEFPPRAAVSRFKGEVMASILAPHILAMFLGMLMSTLAGIRAIAGADFRGAMNWALGFILVGGFVFGPIMQHQAFGEWWAGVPFGWDLTDNKTLLAAVAWLAAWGVNRGARTSRAAIVVAALATLAVFMIPHSTWGSEIEWQ
jgi:hypothetical protein